MAGKKLITVHSCTSESFSGLERYVLDLAFWQHQQQKSVILFCRKETEIEAEALKRGIPIWSIPPNAKLGPLLWLKLKKNWSELFTKDSVTLHMHAGGEPWYHFPWLAKFSKSILHYHIWINHKKKDPLHWLVFSSISEVWTSSETAKVHLSTLLPLTRDKVKVVPYGRDVQMLQNAPVEKWRFEIRKELGLPDSAVLGVCVSRLEPIKGVGELFEAFLKIAPRNPNAHLAIVGNASPNNSEAQSFAQNLYEKHSKLSSDIASRLHLTGFRSDVTRLMAASDFYVLPSYEECMSLAVLDSLILGRPVIGTQSGGTPSVVRPGETGMLVPPQQVNAMAEALEKMYLDSEFRAKLGTGALELGKNYNQEKIFHQIWDSYST